MNADQLAAFQRLPTAQTGASIRDALAQIGGARTSAMARIADAEAEIQEKQAAFTLTSAHRRKLADLIDDQRQDVAMLVALAVRVEAPLADIELIETNERLGRERIALQAELERLEATWAETYPSIDAQLRAALETRADFIRRVKAHNREAGGIFKHLDLSAFTLPTHELKLCKTSRERLLDRVLNHWQPGSRAYQRALAISDEALAALVADLEKPPAPAPAPTAQPYPDTRPTVTIGGVLQTKHQAPARW